MIVSLSAASSYASPTLPTDAATPLRAVRLIAVE
jgi:hypothetical protein